MSNSLGFSKVRRMALAGALALSGALGGCSSANIAGYNLSETLAKISAAIMGDDTVTTANLNNKDCRVLGTLLRNGESFCAGDAAQSDPLLLGFAPVDRRAAADFSLEIARHDNAGIDAPMLAFGMISASNLPTYSYNVKMQNSSGQKADKLAMLQPTTLTLRTGN